MSCVVLRYSYQRILCRARICAYHGFMIDSPDWEGMMRYYLTFALLGLLMGGLCIVLEVHTAAPAVAMMGLFGASDAPAPAPAEGAALPA